MQKELRADHVENVFLYPKLVSEELEYDECHDELWPEMAQALTNCGWINYSLFREGTLAIGYVECIPNAATALATTAKQHVVPA